MGCRTSFVKQAKSVFRSSNIRLKESFRKVAILNPDHLFEQADRLAAPFGPGTIRQVDVRRAISAAYYGVFHAILAAAV